ncbi:TetR/AcrR family transcriptional regulator [Nocardioides sp. CN2-186]|uniref:TetR/AcrR family transcriptional regulator n=1 Tax=Nocardioides tweenelious TaxID=3156607 RepID=UPI0032B3B39C
MTVPTTSAEHAASDVGDARQSAKGTKLNKRGIATRQRLLDTAVQVLGEANPSDVSANLVARQAGVTWGTVQHQFGDADGLWAAVLDFVSTGFPMLRPMDDVSVAGRVAQIVNGLWDFYDTVEARTVLNLRDTLPPNVDELTRDYPLTAQGFAEWDRRWRRAYAKSFRGLVVDGYRLERVRNLLSVSVKALHREPQLSTWTDIDQAREGLIEAVAEYLGREPV